MGYRSDVAYTIRFVVNKLDMTGEDKAKAKESFYTFIAEAKSNAETSLCFSEHELEYLNIDEENLELNFYASYVKWYEEYDGVKCHEALMDLAESWADSEGTDNEYIGCVFARAGESTDDVIEECTGTGDYAWLNISRSIYCDWRE